MLTVLALLASASLASAGTFRVDSTSDSPSAHPGDGRCLSVAGGCTLRAAVQEANASTLTSTIEIPSGTYVLSIAPEGPDFARSGNLFVKGDVTISGEDLANTVIDGGGLDRVFQIEKESTITITGLTIQNGVAKGDNGGGLLNRGHLQMNNVVFRKNKATSDPGGDDGRGGAFANEGDAKLMDVTFEANEAGGRGGGVFNAERARLKMLNGRVTDNRSLTDAGGGVSNAGEISLGILVVRGNHATDGAGVDNVEGKLTLFDLTVADNVAGSNGGGIRNSGSAKLTNVTIGGNQAGRSGGGVENRASGRAVLNNVTVARNTAAKESKGTGGGVLNAATARLELANTIVAENTAGGTPSDCSGSVESAGYNLLGTNAGCELTGSQTGDLVDQSPALVDLAPNGGPAPTYALPAESPAVDAGNPARPTGRSGTCAPADERGVKRPQAGRAGEAPRCDIGAFERQPTS